MQYKGKEITKELLEEAQKCKNAQELIKLAEENGVELSVAEAEAFLDELTDTELDAEALDRVAGGKKKKNPKCQGQERFKDVIYG